MMTHPTGPRPTDEERETWLGEAQAMADSPSFAQGAVLSRRILALLDDLATLRAEREESDARESRYIAHERELRHTRDALTAQVAALTEALCPVCWQPFLHDWEFDEGGRPSECRRCGVEWSHATDNERCPKAPTPPWQRAALPADAPPNTERCVCGHPGDTPTCPIDHDQIQHEQE